MSDYIQINNDRLNFMLDQYNVNIDDLIGHFIYNKDRLLKGYVTIPQLEFLGRYFYTYPDFFLDDEPIDVTSLYSPQHIEAMLTMSDYKRDIKGILLKAELLRENLLKYMNPQMPNNPSLRATDRQR